MTFNLIDGDVVFKGFTTNGGSITANDGTLSSTAGGLGCRHPVGRQQRRLHLQRCPHLRGRCRLRSAEQRSGGLQRNHDLRDGLPETRPSQNRQLHRCRHARERLRIHLRQRSCRDHRDGGLQRQPRTRLQRHDRHGESPGDLRVGPRSSTGEPDGLRRQPVGQIARAPATSPVASILATSPRS